SKPVTQNFCSLKSRTSGRPTYPSPITPMRAVRSSSLAASETAGDEAKYSKELMPWIWAFQVPNSMALVSKHSVDKVFKMSRVDGLTLVFSESSAHTDANLCIAVLPITLLSQENGLFTLIHP